jgi:pimeloyl-ACP methyl ester carboxylesterase
VLEAAGIHLPAVFVGHSIGALFTRYYRDLRPAAVSALVLVEGMHPEQLERSPRQAEEFMWVEEHLRLVPLWTGIGLVRLMAPEGPTLHLPETAAAQLLSFTRTGAFWRTARAEISLLRHELAPYVATIEPDPPIPVTVMTAGSSIWLDPVHDELQEDLLKVGRPSRRIRLEDATQEGIIMRSTSARVVAEEILATTKRAEPVR